MLGADRLASLTDEAGFGLVETLVAALMGVVLAGAMGLILVVSLHQSTRLSDVVEATQLGRTTMNHIVNELHSACIAPNFEPIQEKSKGNELLFVTAYGKEAQLAGAEMHKIVWSGENGTLIDYSVASTGSWPEFAFGAFPAKGTTIGQHVYQVLRGGKPVPIFQYYKYGTEATSSTTTGLSTLTEPLTVPEATGLTPVDAEGTSAVLVSFREAPFNNNTNLSRSAEFSNQVTLSFSVPGASSAIKVESPCE
jgi:Tfp pilus assembly protein PilW